jgi:hypothetical protein
MPESKKAASAKPAGSVNIFAYISFFVAALSLVATMYQAYLNTRYVELFQSNIVRGETARICKDLIDAFFQIKFRTAATADALEREKNPNASSVIAAALEARNAVSRFAAYGTYLANFQGEAKRAQYTALSNELASVIDGVLKSPQTDAVTHFGKADEMFSAMNADCVRSATTRL